MDIKDQLKMNRNQLSKAIILAAGRGERMKSITELLPKCMAPNNGRPLLSYSLAALESNGIKETVVVVGYKSDEIMKAFGDSFQSMKLKYIQNPDYATTDNIYSLWLVEGEMREDILLLEGDLCYDPQIIAELIDHKENDVAIVDNYNARLDGTVIEADRFLSQKLILKKDQGPDFDYSDVWKTVNIYKLSGGLLLNKFLPSLYHHILHRKVKQYYEIVFKELIESAQMSMYVLPVGDHRWAEADTIEDLRYMEEIFLS